ncbi:MAG: hypothetical protein WD066_08070 [Planctomycetaceae bacterium]
MRRKAFARATGALLAVLAALVCGGEAAAQEFTLRGHDLEVQVNANWAGNAFGGYWPVRVRAVNKRPARTVTFRIPGSDGVPSVQQTVALEQNAAARYTLLVPMVGDGTHSEFQVIENGRPLQGMSGGISLPSPDAIENPRPALVIVSPTVKDCAPFEQAVTQIVATAHGGGSGGGSYGYGPHGRHGYGYGYGPSRTEDHQVVQPGQLPDSWLAYSGLDIVAVPLDVLAGLSPDERRPILAWVRTGGTLLVYGLTPAAADRARLDALLNLGGHGFAGGEWTAADASRQAAAAPAPAVEVLIDPFSGEAAESIEFGAVTWTSDAFSQRSLMLGRVIAFRGDPFPGNPADWAWLLQSIGKDDYSWTQRNGVHARTPAGDFLAFSIPGVAGVPVYAFLLLITVFTIVIGPVNYVFCRRKNRMSLLVVTIPAIAFATSLALFGYSAIAHGFGVDSRARSVTFLDQPARTAVTHGRVAYFAGMSPSGGLRFSPDTAVYTVWPELNEPRGPFEGGMVDWTATQAWTAGWLKSRTRTQFRTVTHRDARERIEVAPASEGGLDVTNGLVWGLSLIIVTDAQGNPFAAQNVPRGAGKRAAAVRADDWEKVREAVDADAAADPRHGTFRSSVDPQTFVRNMLTGRDAVNFVGRLSTSPTGGDGDPRPLPPNSYFAILAENPGLDTGVPSARERVGLHLLVGRY